MMEKLHRRTWYFILNSIFAGWVIAAVIAVIFHRFFVFPVWLMVHTTLLGAVSTAIYIWSQHFADTLTRRQAPGGRSFFATRFVSHNVGAVLVVIGIVTKITSLLLIGVLLVISAALAHTIVMILQLRGALTSRFGGLVKFYAVAGIWLAVGSALGFLVTRLPWDDPVREKLFLAHASINIFGWIGATVIGTIIIFLPTVLHARMRENDGKRSNLVLFLITLATFIIAAGALLNNTFIAATGLVVWLLAMAIILNEAIRQIIGAGWLKYAGLSIVAAIFWLTVIIISLAIAFALAPDLKTAITRFEFVLPVLITGFAAQIVVGSLSYLLAVIMGSPAARKAAETELNRGSFFRITAINTGIFVYLLPLPSLAKVLLSLFVFVTLLSFIPLAIRAIIKANKTRKQEPPKTHSVPLLQIKKPEKEPPKPVASGQIITAASSVLILIGVAIALDPAAIGINTIAVAEEEKIVATEEVTEVDVSVTGMTFVPAEINVPLGNRLVVNFSNTGEDTHDITFANGVSSKRLAPGEKETIDVGVITTSMDAWCSITGHRAMGMEAKIVTGEGAQSESESSLESATPVPTFTAVDATLEKNLKRLYIK